MMMNKLIFVACDTSNLKLIKSILTHTQTNKKIHTPEKKTIHFKMSKDLFKILNDEKK